MLRCNIFSICTLLCNIDADSSVIHCNGHHMWCCQNKMMLFLTPKINVWCCLLDHDFTTWKMEQNKQLNWSDIIFLMNVKTYNKKKVLSLYCNICTCFFAEWHCSPKVAQCHCLELVHIHVSQYKLINLKLLSMLPLLSYPGGNGFYHEQHVKRDYYKLKELVFADDLK